MAVAVADQPGDQVVAVGARDRLLARGVDLGDADDVGLVEAGAEILESDVTAASSGAAGARRSPGPRVACRAAFSTAAISTGWWP